MQSKNTFCVHFYLQAVDRCAIRSLFFIVLTSNVYLDFYILQYVQGFSNTKKAYWTENDELRSLLARWRMGPTVRGRLEETRNGEKTEKTTAIHEVCVTMSAICYCFILYNIRLIDREAGVRFVNHDYDYRLNRTTRSFVTINHNHYNFRKTTKCNLKNSF